MSATTKLIDAIIDQELDLGDYSAVLPPIIQEHFKCLKKNQGRTGTVNDVIGLVDRVIRWENGEQDATLELTLENAFEISIKKPYKKKNTATNG